MGHYLVKTPGAGRGCRGKTLEQVSIIIILGQPSAARQRQPSFLICGGLQLNRDEAQQPSGKLIDVFISKVGSSPGGQ